MLKFGISIYSISRKLLSNEITPEEGIRRLASFGADTIELVPFGIDMINDPGLVGRLLATAGEAGVQIANYSLNANFLRLTEAEYIAETERVKAHIDVAGALKIPTMRIDCAAYRRPIEENSVENFQNELPTIIKTYQELCNYAEKYNLKLLLENHGFHVNGSERVTQVMTAMVGQNFGIQLDVGNFVCVDEIAEIAVKKMLRYATVIHMKDFYIRGKNPGDATQFDCSGSWFRSVNGRYLRGSILAQGDLDMYCIIKQIKDSGFDGNIFIEYEGMEDCFYGTKVSFDNLKRIYNEA